MKNKEILIKKLERFVELSNMTHLALSVADRMHEIVEEPIKYMESHQKMMLKYKTIENLPPEKLQDFLSSLEEIPQEVLDNLRDSLSSHGFSLPEAK